LLVQIIKFVHVLTAVSLLAVVFIACFKTKHAIFSPVISAFLPCGLVLSGITGCLLVYPKHFDFHTPWIQVALLATGISLLPACLVFYPSGRGSRWIRLVSCLLLVFILPIIVHDAVTKSTFVF